MEPMQPEVLPWTKQGMMALFDGFETGGGEERKIVTLMFEAMLEDLSDHIATFSGTSQQHQALCGLGLAGMLRAAFTPARLVAEVTGLLIPPWMHTSPERGDGDWRNRGGAGTTNY